MNPEEKKDLYCNFKWLHKLNRFGETLVTDENLNVKLVLLSRHEAFRKELRTSKTKFKKISAEHLNTDKNFCLNLCEMRINTDVAYYSTNYHVMFINSQVDVQDVLKYVNMMLMDIVHCYYPVLKDNDDKYTHNNDMRDMLLTKWGLDLSNSLDSTYMELHYNNPEGIPEPKEFVDNIDEFKNACINKKTNNAKNWQKGCDDA